MPELAEVEYYRKQWDAGMNSKILRVALHAEKRIFRGVDTKQLIQSLTGSKLNGSIARGKQMLFRFTGDAWLGIHLGMTGKLSSAPAQHEPGKHDHLVLFQPKNALVFTDMRQFGRVQFHLGKEEPEWWSKFAAAPNEAAFTFRVMAAFLGRHPKLAIKPALLLQEGFPGIGNWMADEILWRAGVHPEALVRALSDEQLKRLWRETRFVSREALKTIGNTYGDPPKGWLFHQRWGSRGVCPKHKTPLTRATVGGRTTAWCPKCQA